MSLNTSGDGSSAGATFRGNDFGSNDACVVEVLSSETICALVYVVDDRGVGASDSACFALVLVGSGLTTVVRVFSAFSAPMIGMGGDSGDGNCSHCT